MSKSYVKNVVDADGYKKNDSTKVKNRKVNNTFL